MADQQPHDTPVTASQLQSWLDAQKSAFWKALPVSPKTRIERLNTAVDLLLTHQDALCEAMDEDYQGRPHTMSLLTDVVSSVSALKHARNHVHHWMRRKRVPVRFPLGLLGAKAWVEHQPKGVVGIVSPWNFPVNLVFGPLAGAFAAGCHAMIKPSEFTPHTSALLQQLVAEYFDPEVCRVITGDAEVAKAFTALPFDHLFFTGSTTIGRHVMRAASEHLTPVTLELGGKSPAIIGEDANLKRAAQAIVMGKLLNAGQVCLAPDYILCPEHRKADLIQAIQAQVAAQYPNLASNSDYAALAHDGQMHRMQQLLAEAQQAGTEHITINPGDSCAKNRRLPLHILINPDDRLKVMQEEIFGPILPIVTINNLSEALHYIQQRPRPLGLYYFGNQDKSRVLDETISGGISLNETLLHFTMEDLPFGGSGDSGLGAYHGETGFKTFSHEKAVFQQAPLNITKIAGMIAPYGKRIKRTFKMELRR